MNDVLDAIFQRRAVKVFEPVAISAELREQILNAARHAPSSFNSQPYKFYWVQSATTKAAGGETVPRTEARGDRLRLSRGGGRPRLAVCHVASPAGVDAQEQLQRRKNSHLRATSRNRPDTVHPRTIRNLCFNEPPQWRRALDRTVTVL